MLKKLVKSEWVQIPLCCILATGGGYLLSIGTVSGIVSPLAAAVAGICSPLYSFCILLGALLSYCIQGAPEEMQFLLTCLTAVFCIRIFFCERYKPWISAVMTAFTCIGAGMVLDIFLQGRSGKLPLYILEAFMTGTAAYFISDAVQNLKENKKIQLSTGKSFTYAICYLFCITALCGIDFQFCNLGRIAGMTITLLAARQFRQAAGTLCGALTACGVVLCSVSLGMPLLFLPVTAMLAGFLYQIPNAFYIPVFFLMQICSSAVLDSSIAVIRILAELIISCTLYAVFCQTGFRKFISLPVTPAAGERQVVQQEIFLSQALQELREESSAVMRHLTLDSPADPIQQAKTEICQECKYFQKCWKLHQEQTEKIFRQLLHTPSVMPEILETCPERKHISDKIHVCAQRRTVSQIQNQHLISNREMMLESLRLLEHITADSARRRSLQFCEAETAVLKNMLLRCAVNYEGCFVYRLRSGRYAAEIYSAQEDFPLATIQELFSRQTEKDFSSVSIAQKRIVKYCIYEIPAYSLVYTLRSQNAPAYERCGDHADAFTDSVGNQYLILSDGMGSGSTAALASRIAVRTLRNLIRCDMPVDSALHLLNALLMTETNTENFATADILFLNADTGELLFYKSGSAAALFYHASEMHQITAKSFPLGMMADAPPAKITMQAQAGDEILLLSDGVSEAEYSYIRQLLPQNFSTEILTDKIFEKAAVFHGGVLRDDMTVISAQVTSRISPAQQKQTHKKRQHSTPQTVLR